MESFLSIFEYKTHHSSFAKAIPFQMKDFGVDGGGGLGGGGRGR